VRSLLVLACCAACEGGADRPKSSVEHYLDYKDKARHTEAQVALSALRQRAEEARIELGHYPIGRAPATPASPCCAATDQRCAPDPNQWIGLWADLRFRMDEPFRFQYAYESDGKTFTATAVGDVACDGKLVRFRADSEANRVVGPY
jgi:hypothetical protein